MLTHLSKLAPALVVLACGSAVLAQPANDSCSTPDPAIGYGSFAFDSSLATSTPLAIGCATGDAFNDVWICWTATQGGPTVVDLCAGDVGFDSVITVFDGCGCPADGSDLVCNDDFCGFQSRVAFVAATGQMYMIRIGGYSEGEQGAGTLNISSGIIQTVTNPSNSHVYQLFAASTWTSAEAIAVSLGGHLVTINDAAENDFVQFSVLGFDGQDRRAWLGLNDAASEGNFVWSSGEPVTYTNWNAGEPNNANGNENYAEMLGSNGQWNDQPDGGNGFVQYGIAEIGGPPPCTADFNNDGTVNSQDFFDFVTAFFAQAPSADFNHDSFINSQDFFDFLAAFFTPC